MKIINLYENNLLDYILTGEGRLMISGNTATYEFLIENGMNLMERGQLNKIKNKMLSLIKITLLSIITVSMHNCNTTEIEVIKNVDLLLEQHRAVYFSNNPTQEDKYNFLYLVYRSYLESEDSYFSTVAESILIHATKYSSLYCYYLFNNKMIDIYKDKIFDINTIIKHNRLSSILSMQSQSYDLFFMDESEQIDPSFSIEDTTWSTNELYSSECEKLLNKSFDFDKFKNLINRYIGIINLEKEEAFKEKSELRIEIINMYYQLLYIKTEDYRFDRK